MGKMILIDDEQDILDVLEMIIESELEVEIFKAGSGNKAIQILKGHKDIDLIVSDYNMPDGNGASVFNYNANEKNLPFIFVSGGFLEDYKDVKNFFDQNQLNKYISKPIDEKVLLANIRAALEARGQRKEAELKGNDFKRVKIILLEKFSLYKYDLFLGIGSDKFVKVSQGGDPSGFEQIKKYHSKGEEYVYLRNEDFQAAITDLIQSLMAKVEISKSIVDSLFYTGLGIDLVASGLQALGVTKEQVALVDRCVESCVKNLKSDPHVYSLLDTFFKERGYLVSHSITAIHVSYLIAKELGLANPEILNKLTYAALLHDITLADAALSEIYDLSESRFELLDWKTQRVLKEHPLIASELIKKMDHVPLEVVSMIHEHHEKANGSGYPRGLEGNRIQLLSAIFIISLRIAHFLYYDKLDKVVIEELKADIEKRFKSGNFKKPSTALIGILEKAVEKLN